MVAAVADGVSPAAAAAAPAGASPAPTPTAPAATPAPAPAPVAAAEVKYDLRAPDKSGIDAAHLNIVSEVAKTSGMTPAQAQAVVDLHARLGSDFAKAQAEAKAAEAATWKGEWAQDKAFGGEKQLASDANYSRFAARFFTPAFAKTLAESGLEHYPEFRRVVATAGATLGEATPVTTHETPKAAIPTAAELFPLSAQQNPDMWKGAVAK